MTPLDTDNDEFLRLLTEALRAGPGSPEWHQAVSRLRAERSGQADEYALLLEARQRLESGRGYRSVRAGPGFTAKVLRGIEEQGAGPARGPSAANFITVASVLLVLGVLVLLGYVLLRAADRGRTTEQELASQVFIRTVLDTRFAGSIPPQWRTIGTLGLEMRNGLSLARGAGEKDEYRGGGVVTATAFAAEETWAAEVELRPSAREAIVQLFVSPGGEFTDDRGNSPGEFQVVIRGQQLSVVTPDGREEARHELDRGSARIRIAINRDAAVIKLADQPLWMGQHQLDPSRPRLFGARLLRRSDTTNDTAVIQSIQLLRP